MFQVMGKDQRDKWRQTHLNFFNKPEEVWVFHPSTNLYVISNKGRVMNFITKNILTSHPNQQGYRMINIKYSDGTRRSSMVHRLVAETFYPFFNINASYYEVNHIDGNKTNNDLSNLEWCTRQENLDHARKNKLFKQSIKKLTDVDIADIKEFRKLGFKIRDVANLYKISERYVGFLTKDK